MAPLEGCKIQTHNGLQRQKERKEEKKKKTKDFQTKALEPK